MRTMTGLDAFDVLSPLLFAAVNLLNRLVPNRTPIPTALRAVLVGKARRSEGVQGKAHRVGEWLPVQLCPTARG